MILQCKGRTIGADKIPLMRERITIKQGAGSREQLRGVGMSIPNNNAESTGTNMIGEQRMLLRVSKRECFEAANILVILEIKRLISKEFKDSIYYRLYTLCKRIQKYSDKLSED